MEMQNDPDDLAWASHQAVTADEQREELRAWAAHWARFDVELAGENDTDDGDAASDDDE